MKILIIATFKSYYEYEIEYVYDSHVSRDLTPPVCRPVNKEDFKRSEGC